MIPRIMRICRRNRGYTTIKFLYKTLKITEILIWLILINITSGCFVEIVCARCSHHHTGKKQKSGES